MDYSEDLDKGIQRYKQVMQLYNCADKGERLGKLPLLSAMELEQLQQLFHPRWDGNVNSKSMRDALVRKGLIDRWNGWNFISQLGIAVLDTLGLLEEEWESKVHEHCNPDPPDGTV